MIYLDAAATTPVRREVIEAMWPYLTGEFGNPSSHHSLGEQAAEALAKARAECCGQFRLPRQRGAVYLGRHRGGTIWRSRVLRWQRHVGRHLVTTTIEHEAVLASCEDLERHHGFRVSRIGVDRFGMIDLAELRAAIGSDTTLCSVMLANNEVGTLQPMREIVTLARAANVPVHTDAVQAAGALPLQVREMAVDAMSLAGHKLGAPKGTGVLYLRGRTPIEPVLHGGGQERGRRSGTENVAGAVGFALALELATRSQPERSRQLERNAGRVDSRSARRGSGGYADRPSDGAAAEQCLILLSGDQRGVRAVAARRARGSCARADRPMRRAVTLHRMCCWQWGLRRRLRRRRCDSRLVRARPKSRST